MVQVQRVEMLKSFTVTFPTEAGFIGRECNSQGCAKYFKVHEDSLRERMYCPYCGVSFGKEALFTRDQLKYAEDQAVEHAKEYVYGEFDRMFAKLARNFRSGPVRIKHTPIRYRAKSVVPKYREKDVDSRLTCPECNVLFQVFGIFGFCPGCRTENQLIYDANLAILRQELANASDGDRALRHAYSDLVSTFEGFCARRAHTSFANANFQDLFEARRVFKTHCAVDILDGLATDELLTLRRAFQKRHAHIHNGGIIGERYVRKIPEDSALLGKHADLSLEEFELAARALGVVIARLATLPRPS
jgi:hypothetical protein